jgi:hypothetical protein
MNTAVQAREYVSPSKLSALDDRVDVARGQLRALEAEQQRARQALDAKHQTMPREVEQPLAAQTPSMVGASHAGLVVRVLARPDATITASTPLLSVLGDAAVPALLISCSEQEAHELLESPEVRLSVHDKRLSAIVTRLVEHGPRAPSAGEELRTVELALNDTAQLAELVKRAEVGTPIMFELPQRRTLFSQASHWLQHEFQ